MSSLLTYVLIAIALMLSNAISVRCVDPGWNVVSGLVFVLCLDGVSDAAPAIGRGQAILNSLGLQN